MWSVDNWHDLVVIIALAHSAIFSMRSSFAIEALTNVHKDLDDWKLQQGVALQKEKEITSSNNKILICDYISFCVMIETVELRISNIFVKINVCVDTSAFPRDKYCDCTQKRWETVSILQVGFPKGPKCTCGHYLCKFRKTCELSKVL